MAEIRIKCHDFSDGERHNSQFYKGKQKCKHYTVTVVFFIIVMGFLSLVHVHFALPDGEIQTDYHSHAKHRIKRQLQVETCQVDVCLTQECIHTASDILKSMDTSVDPCQDFYQYTCGSWIKENRHKVGIDDLFYAISHSLLPEKIDLKLNELLKQNLPLPDEVLDTKPYQNLFAFHETCLLVGHLPDDGLLEALDLLKSLQEFHLGRPFDPTSWNLTRAILELLRINGAPLFDIVLGMNTQNPQRYAIDITPPRRYGLIPTLIGPSFRNPGVSEYFKHFGRRTYFGNLKDNVFMRDLFSLLEKATPTRSNFKGHGSQTREGRKAFNKLVANPAYNVIPLDDFFEKTTALPTKVPAMVSTASSLDPMTMENTAESELTTFESVPASEQAMVENTAFPSLRFEDSTSESRGQSDGDATTVPSTLPSVTTPVTTTESVTPDANPSALYSDSPHSSTLSPFVSPDFALETTELTPTPSDAFEIPEYDDYEEELRKVISRKTVFKLLKRNVDNERTKTIGEMVQNSFSNITEEAWESAFGHFQQDDIFSAVMDHFVPLLDEIQPTPQESMQAQQHAMVYNLYSLDELQDLVPVIEWRYLLSELFGRNLTDEDNIYVYHPSYMVQLNHLLTALDPWVIHYGLVALYAYDILREVTTVSPKTDREDFCLQATKNVFGDVMSHMYLHHVGNKTLSDLRKHVTSIIDKVSEEVEESLEEATWLTESDRSEALIKFRGLQAEIGALDKHWDISYVNESHAKLNLSSDASFLENVMGIYRMFRTELYRYYDEPVDRDTLIWSFTVQPFIVNAFHMQSTNTIVFPKAFFQNPYYLPKAPEYINYGSAGTAIAHEIFHGFDLTGILFDHQGVMSRPYSNDTRSHLRGTVDCYHKLLSDAFYEELPLDDTYISMEIDSTNTLNENLADIAGIRHAFRAYQRWESENYREPKLPAVSLSPHQLFFVAAVRPYCAVMPNLAKIFLMEMDEHLPNGMRMNALLMNMPEFAEVFQCSPGSRMRANQTCAMFP